MSNSVKRIRRLEINNSPLQVSNYYIQTGGVKGNKFDGLLNWDNKVYNGIFPHSTISTGTNPTGLCYSPINNKIYVANITSGNVMCIEPSSNSVISTISASSGTYTCFYCPINRQIYVSNYYESKINVIEPLSNSITSTISLGTGANLTEFAFSPSSEKLFVGDYNLAQVFVIDPTSNSVINTISVIGSARSLCYCPSNNNIYVAISGPPNKVVVIDSSSYLTSTISIPSSVYSVVYCPSNDRIYIGAINGLYVMNPLNNSIVATISSDGIHNLCYYPSLDRLFMTTETNQIRSLDPQTNTLVGSLNVVSSSLFLTFSPSNDRLYVASYGSNSVVSYFCT